MLAQLHFLLDFIAISVILYTAAMTGYVVIVGDTFSRLFEQIGKVNRSLLSCVCLTEIGFIMLSAFLLNRELPPALAEPRSIIIKIIAVILVMMPLSMVRRISKLEKV